VDNTPKKASLQNLRKLTKVTPLKGGKLAIKAYKKIQKMPYFDFSFFLLLYKIIGDLAAEPTDPRHMSNPVNRYC
jgi:hypothetical protein